MLTVCGPVGMSTPSILARRSITLEHAIDCAQIVRRVGNPLLGSRAPPKSRSAALPPRRRRLSATSPRTTLRLLDDPLYGIGHMGRLGAYPDERLLDGRPLEAPGQTLVVHCLPESKTGTFLERCQGWNSAVNGWNADRRFVKKRRTARWFHVQKRRLDRMSQTHP